MNRLKELPNLEGWNVNLLLAIMWQESKFDLNARRFEPHVFKRRTGKEAKTYTEAVRISEKEAFNSTSWGVGQVMGFNINGGAKTHQEARKLVQRLKNPEDQILVMLNFIENNRVLHTYFRSVVHKTIVLNVAPNFAKIAKIYNGSGYKKNNYDVLIKEHYDKYVINGNIVAAYHMGHKVHMEKFTTANIYDPRILKMQKEIGVEADGYFGKNTLQALNKHNDYDLSKELQSKVQDEIDREEIEKLKQPLTEKQRMGVVHDGDKVMGTVINGDKIVLNGTPHFQGEKIIENGEVFGIANIFPVMITRNDGEISVKTANGENVPNKNGVFNIEMDVMSDEPEQTARVMQEQNLSWFGKLLKRLGF